MCDLVAFYLQPGLSGDYFVSNLDEISASQLSAFSCHRCLIVPVFDLIIFAESIVVVKSLRSCLGFPLANSQLEFVFWFGFPDVCLLCRCFL
jgi:hypothetical protein